MAPKRLTWQLWVTRLDDDPSRKLKRVRIRRNLRKPDDLSPPSSLGCVDVSARGVTVEEEAADDVVQPEDRDASAGLGCDAFTQWTASDEIQNTFTENDDVEILESLHPVVGIQDFLTLVPDEPICQRRFDDSGCPIFDYDGYKDEDRSGWVFEPVRCDPESQCRH